MSRPRPGGHEAEGANAVSAANDKGREAWVHSVEALDVEAGAGGSARWTLSAKSYLSGADTMPTY